MSTYELTVVYSPELTEAKQKKALKELESVVKKHKGKVVSSDHWGMKQLAYPIKKLTEAYYGRWMVELPEKGPDKVTKVLKVDDSILRYLFVKTNNIAKKSKLKK